MDFARREVEAAVAAGVIQNFDSNSLQYQCVVCPREGCGDVLPHILSKEHRNSVIWEGIRQSPPSRALLDQMSIVVRTAKLNGEVGAVDKNHFSYRCNICYGKKPFNGVAPLEAHLNGKEHEKSKRNKQYTTQYPRTIGEPVQVTTPMHQPFVTSLTEPRQVSAPHQKDYFPSMSKPNKIPEYGIPNIRASPPEADQYVHAPTPIEAAWPGVPHTLLTPTDLQLSPDSKTRVNNPPMLLPPDKKTSLADRKAELQETWQDSYDTRVFSQRSTHSPWQDSYNMTAPKFRSTQSHQQNSYDTTAPSLKNLYTPKQDSCDKMTNILGSTNSSLPFDPGQHVLIDLSCGKRKVPAIPWDGPYIVQASDETDENFCLVQKVNGKCKKVALEYCMPYSPRVIHDGNMHQQSEEKVDSAIPDSTCDTMAIGTAVSRSEPLLEPQPGPVETSSLSSVFQQGAVYKRLPALSNLSAISSTQNSPQKSMTQTTVVLSDDGEEIFVHYADEHFSRLWKPSKVYHSRGTQTDVKPAILTTASVQTIVTMSSDRRRR